MTEKNILEYFDERYSEIKEYIELLINIDEAMRNGTPRIGGDDGPSIKPKQQKILYSSVYLQLYNLVESTITNCLDQVTQESINNNLQPSDLSRELRDLWIRYIARTHTELTAENRLKSAIEMCETLISQTPIQMFEIEKGGGGNWHDEEIHTIAKRIGLKLSIKKDLHKRIKRPIRNDLGALKLVVSLRNQLAHGSITFVNCGENNTANELKELADLVAEYLREVVINFIEYIQKKDYLSSQHKQKHLNQPAT